MKGVIRFAISFSRENRSYPIEIPLGVFCNLFSFLSAEVASFIFNAILHADDCREAFGILECLRCGNNISQQADGITVIWAGTSEPAGVSEDGIGGR